MKKIICHGDSLTEGSDVAKGYTWPSLIANELDVRVYNKGIGGDTTGGLLARFYFDVIKNQPDLVFILGGTNDLWWDLNIHLIQANIFAMACQAQHHDIAPVIGTPLPLFMEAVRKQDMQAPVQGFEKCNQALKQLSGEVSAAAEKSDIPCLDFYHLFMNHAGDVQGQYFLEDGLHLNRAGHRLMARKTSEYLRTIFHFR